MQTHSYVFRDDDVGDRANRYFVHAAKILRIPFKRRKGVEVLAKLVSDDGGIRCGGAIGLQGYSLIPLLATEGVHSPPECLCRRVKVNPV